MRGPGVVTRLHNKLVSRSNHVAENTYPEGAGPRLAQSPQTE